MNFVEIMKEYKHLVDLFSSILLILPLIFLILNRKLLYSLYVISIVTNLPIIFISKFNFSYEIYLGLIVVTAIIKEWYFNREIKYLTNKPSILLVLSVALIFFINVGTSFFNFNSLEVKRISTIFVSNIFILLVFTYFIKNSHMRNIVIKSIFLGGTILAISIFLELYYNYYILNINNHRYGGLLIDQNGAALVLNLSFVLSFYIDRFYRSFKLIVRLVLRILIVLALFATASRSGFIGFTFIVFLLLGRYVICQEFSYKPLALFLVLSLLIFIFRHQVSTFILEFTKMVDLKRISNLFKPDNSLPPPVVVPPNNSLPPIIMDPTTSGRWQLIYNSIHVFRHNFLVGVGIGNLPNLIDPTYKMNAHNLWLQLIAESGIFMVFSLLFFGLVLSFYLIDKQFKNKTIFIFTFIVIFIDSFFNHNLYNLNIVWLFLAVVISSNVLSLKKYYEIKLNTKILINQKAYFDYKKIQKKDYDYEFTILTPTFNRAHLLNNLYYSLVYQTNKNFQWIIIDDGSSDETIKLVNEFMDESELCIKLINQENQGKHVAINSGLEGARGRYCLIVDSDDYLTVDALETLSNWFLDEELMNNHICAIAGLKANSSLKVIGRFPKVTSKIIANNIERDNLPLSLDKAECYFTDILKKYKFIQFDKEKFLSERIVWDKMANDGYNIIWHDKVIYICEYQEDGLSSRGGQLLIDNPLGYTEFIKGFLQYDYSIKSRIYHIGSYTNHLKEAYQYNYSKIAQISQIRLTEIIVCSLIHKLLKTIKRVIT